MTQKMTQDIPTLRRRMDAFLFGMTVVGLSGYFGVLKVANFIETYQERPERAIGTIVSVQKTEVFRSVGRSAEGTLGRRAIEPCPVIRFQTEAGKAIDFLDKTACNGQVGEELPVIYNSKNPKESASTLIDNRRFSLIAAALPVVMIGFIFCLGLRSTLVGLGIVSAQNSKSLI
ncbi:MAG: DUF3592 domain-containing protein [Leptolyngbyaceae cyanobacterium CSU_1_3]|nr:DUF3592 domain-containing protein [Leptolyngbyaceae cyanobacterium CSU_1_3]